MTPQEAAFKAGEWIGEAGGLLLPQLTANELAGIVNEVSDPLLAKIDRLRIRVESMRGMLKTCAGKFYEVGDHQSGDACMEAAGDMESSSDA